MATLTQTMPNYTQEEDSGIENNEEGASTSQTKCQVCYEDEDSNNSIVTFCPCEHNFCPTCATSYFIERTKNHQIRQLECLIDGCKGTIEDKQIKEIIGETEFERYKRLLDRVGHFVNEMGWCPKVDCQQEARINKSLQTGECTKCGHVFCVLCEGNVHIGEECPLLQIDDKKELLRQFKEGSKEERGKLYEIYNGKEQFLQLIDHIQTELWILENSKPCPNCNSMIEKIDGCNKVECTQCDVYFCWLCLKVLNRSDPYSHFNTLDYGNEGCLNRTFDDAPDQQGHVQNRHHRPRPEPRHFLDGDMRGFQWDDEEEMEEDDGVLRFGPAVFIMDDLLRRGPEEDWADLLDGHLLQELNIQE